jgi:23S rRNA (uracil-5-)-methyltransferase RumA
MFRRGEIVTLKIDAFGFGGRGIAKIPTENSFFIVFVDNAFPGQTVKAKIDIKKKQYAEAKLIEVIERSPLEIPSDFQEISGAPYIFVPREIQKKEKIASTLTTFSKISGIKDIETYFDGFIDSPEGYFYRNKMEYSFSRIGHDLHTGEDIEDAFVLGFKRRGTWWKVENLEKPSGLFDEKWEEKLIEICNFCKETQLPAWHPPQKNGFFRHLVVRKSFFEDKFLINLVTSSEDSQSFDSNAFTRKLIDLHGDRIGGIQWTLNDDVADRSKIENGQTKILFGKNFVEEKIAGLRFQMRMESFFQTNPKCAERLYDKAIDYLFEGLNTEKEILDLFCGTGTIGQLIAKRDSNLKITGVDIVEEAIVDATENARLNGIQNVNFLVGDVGKFLKEHPHFIGNIDAIMLDPPRAGIAPKTLQKTIDLGARSIVYISCNPSTQARDAQKLLEANYTLEKFCLVDQFPHTGHIESIAKFTKI